MRRRDLLKLMAASGPALAASGCGGFMEKQPAPATVSGVPSSVKTLNLVFEGPMIFLVGASQTQVLVPRVDGHRYRIDKQTAAASTFTLKGVSGPGDAARTQYEMPRGSDAFKLSASQLHLSLDLSKDPFFTFLLPAPNRVVALNARDADIVDAFGNRRTAVMPTSYAFVYDVTDSASLALDPNPGWAPRDRAVQGRFTNLVVAAGLTGNALDPTGQHARAAFAEMTSYFPGLSMQFFDSGVEMQTGSVEGLPPELMHGRSVASATTTTPRMAPAVYNPRSDSARVILAAAIVDCKTGGVIVTTP